MFTNGTLLSIKSYTKNLVKIVKQQKIKIIKTTYKTNIKENLFKWSCDTKPYSYLWQLAPVFIYKIVSSYHCTSVCVLYKNPSNNAITICSHGYSLKIGLNVSLHIHLYSRSPPVSTKSHSCPNVCICLHTCAPVIHLTKLLQPTSKPLERSLAQTDLGLIFLLHKHRLLI